MIESFQRCIMIALFIAVRRYAKGQEVRSLFDRSSQLSLVKGRASQVDSNFSHKKNDDGEMCPRIHDLDVEEIIGHLCKLLIH